MCRRKPCGAGETGAEGGHGWEVGGAGLRVEELGPHQEPGVEFRQGHVTPRCTLGRGEQVGGEPPGGWGGGLAGDQTGRQKRGRKADGAGRALVGPLRW